MSDSATLASDKPLLRRKGNAEVTSAAILQAAISQFARAGYDLASLRDIAGEAGVDVALIKRYFGGKDGLFEAALEATFPHDFMHAYDRASFARAIATAMADPWIDDEPLSHRFQFLLRAATSPTTAPRASAVIQERFLGPIGDWLGGDKANVRARVLAATYFGFLVERMTREKPLTGSERADFIESTVVVLDAIVRP